jgi:hypothetical protein
LKLETGLRRSFADLALQALGGFDDVILQAARLGLVLRVGQGGLLVAIARVLNRALT